MTDPTDASTNSIPKNYVDAKQPFVPLGQARSPLPGFHPSGIDNNNGSIFMPVTDNTDATSIDSGSSTPNGNPNMPRPGSRLIDNQSSPTGTMQ